MVQVVALDVMGHVVDLELDGSGVDALASAVAVAWDRCLLADDAAGDATAERRVRVVLDEDETVVARARAEGAVAGTTELVVMDELTTRLVREGLELRVGDRWLLHACALADPETGATVVLVAPSGTGKTTASQTLARTFGYVTDETAVIERDGTMTPFPKPLSLLVDGTRPKRQVSPTELDMVPSPPAPWLAKVALLRRDPEATGVTVEPVGDVEGLALLAEQTSSLHLLEDPLATVAQMLAVRGGLDRLVYAECADLAPLLAEWLRDAERPPAVAPRPGHVANASASTTTVLVKAEDDAPRLHRLPVLDELVADGEMVVLKQGEVLALSEVATTLLAQVAQGGEQGVELDEVERALALEFGAPEGVSVAEAVAPIVDDLVGRGLLQRT